MFADIEQQRTGAAGEIKHAAELLHRSGLGFLAVQCDDARKNRGNLLRRVELARLLAGTGGELADQIFVGITERINVGGKFIQPLGDFLDDVAQLLVFFRVRFAELFRAEIDFGKKALKRALKLFVFNILETVPQGFEQFTALGFRQIGDAGVARHG